MTTLEKIRTEIEQHKNDKFNCIGVNDVLKIIDKYAEQDKLMIIEANVNGYTQGLKDAQRQSCKNCKQDPKECGNDAHYGFCQNWEYAEQEPCEDCDYSEIIDWEQDAKTGKAKPIYWCERHKEPCDDAVSRQAVLDVIEREQFKGDAISEIEKLPSVRPQEQTGHWIEKYHEAFNKYYCDKCGFGSELKTNYCPDCGAKMVESQEGSDKE